MAQTFIFHGFGITGSLIPEVPTGHLRQQCRDPKSPGKGQQMTGDHNKDPPTNPRCKTKSRADEVWDACETAEAETFFSCVANDQSKVPTLMDGTMAAAEAATH